MKTKSILMLLAIFPFCFIYGEENENKDPYININISKTNRPRTPGVMDCPISGYYSNGVVYLYFNDVAEDVSVEISNTNTGDLWSETLISPSYCEQIVIGNNAGSYSIAITTSSGDIYHGFFQL